MESIFPLFGVDNLRLALTVVARVSGAQNERETERPIDGAVESARPREVKPWMLTKCRMF